MWNWHLVNIITDSLWTANGGMIRSVHCACLRNTGLGPPGELTGLDLGGKGVGSNVATPLSRNGPRMRTAILTQAFGLPRDNCHLRCEGRCHRAVHYPPLFVQLCLGCRLRQGSWLEDRRLGRRRHFSPGTQPVGPLVLVLSLAAHRNLGHSSLGRAHFEPTASPATHSAAGPSP